MDTRFYGLGQPGPKGNQGPIGPPGPSMKVVGRRASLADLEAAYPDGSAVDGVFLIGTQLPYLIYYWELEARRWVLGGTWVSLPGAQGIQGLPGPQGPEGPMGPQGSDGLDGRQFTIKGRFDTVGQLVLTFPTGSEGDAYAIGSEQESELTALRVFVWDTNTSSWENVGRMLGPRGLRGLTGPRGVQGVQGVPGKDGAGLFIIDVFETEAELFLAYPQALRGDAAIVGDTLWFWNAELKMWQTTNQALLDSATAESMRHDIEIIAETLDTSLSEFDATLTEHTQTPDAHYPNVFFRNNGGTLEWSGDGVEWQTFRSTADKVFFEDGSTLEEKFATGVPTLDADTGKISLSFLPPNIPLLDAETSASGGVIFRIIEGNLQYSGDGGQTFREFTAVWAE